MTRYEQSASPKCTLILQEIISYLFKFNRNAKRHLRQINYKAMPNPTFYNLT